MCIPVHFLRHEPSVMRTHFGEKVRSIGGSVEASPTKLEVKGHPTFPLVGDLNSEVFFTNPFLNL